MELLGHENQGIRFLDCFLRHVTGRAAPRERTTHVGTGRAASPRTVIAAMALLPCTRRHGLRRRQRGMVRMLRDLGEPMEWGVRSRRLQKLSATSQ